jgi:hypothetical protein
MKESFRATLRSAFFEALFVVFGVALALAANEWRQSVKTQAMADGALESIVAELTANLDLVQTSTKYHQDEARMLQQKMAAGETAVPADFPRGFVNPAWVTSTAWEVAKTTGVVADMDYHTVLTLSETYDRLARYTKQAELVGPLIYEAIFKDGPQSIGERPMNLMTLVYTFIYRESEVMADLTATLAVLQP